MSTGCPLDFSESKKKLNPIGSMGLVYLLTFTLQINQMQVKYTSPMDLVGTLPRKFNMDIPIYHTDTVFFKGVTLLETNISPTSRHFWVDDCPNFPFGGICDSSLKGTIFSIHVSKKPRAKSSRFRGIKALHLSIQGSAVSASAGVEYLPVTNDVRGISGPCCLEDHPMTWICG